MQHNASRVTPEVTPGATPERCRVGPAPDWMMLNLIGESPAFRHALARLQQWSAVDATVLLCGETGTGKELAARALHYLSARRGEPFVAVNCGAIPDSMIEAELFGHVRGAFTDAKRDSRGIVGNAERGTLFLDEIDSLSPRGQAVLLRFAQDRSYRPVGASRVELGDVRIVAATNADLEARCAAGQFRQDLLYRLNLLTLDLPPLREREGDALLLAQAFVDRFCRQYRSAPRRLDAASIEALRRPLPWRGNVRELEHRVHRQFLLAEGDVVALDLALAAAGAQPIAGPAAACGSFAEGKACAIAAFERAYVERMLQQARGNLSLAARLAGKERSRFGKLVRKYAFQRAAFDASPVCD